VTAVLGVLASYAVAGPVTANAASVTGSSFEIDTDANLPVNGGGTALDWLTGGSGTAMRAGVHVQPDLPTGGDDDSFTQGTHEDSASTTIGDGSIPDQKSDLTNFGLYVEKYATATFVNVFWTRVQDPNGTANMDFEFNQSATRLNDVAQNSGMSTHVIPVRTAGDILITYDLSKGGTHPELGRRTWTGSEWGPETTFSDTQALGSINTAPIATGDAGGLGALSARTFGEASINLAVLVPDTQACTTYGSVYVKSRASDSFDAELKDFIAPEPVTISNCGSVTIHKTESTNTGAHSPLAGATFTLYHNVAPLTAPHGAGDTITSPALACTTDAAGTCTINNVPKGDYLTVETVVPAGHDPAPDQAFSITAGDQDVPITVDDPIQYGTIVVVKHAVPQDAQDFTFTLDKTDFSLDDDPNDATLPNTRSFTVPVGSHDLSETSIPSGWVNTSLVCDPAASASVTKPDATVTVTKGQTVTCTYTDTFTVRNVDLQTLAAVHTANTSWDDTASLTGDGVHPVTGTVTFFACDPASTATACTSGGTQVGSPATVTHVSGTSYTATTTAPWAPTHAGWSCFRAEYTSTSAFYASSSHTNAGSECFFKSNANLTVTKTAVAAYGRTYQWTIDKQVDQTRIDIAQGGTAAFHYTVSVGNSHTDNAWTVTGKITVANPNNVPFTGVSVTDAIDNGAGSCAVTGGSNVTVPAGQSVQLDYTCTYASVPSPSAGTNTATASWNKTTFFTPQASATGTATVDFSNVTPSVTDEIVTVTDSVAGTLGTVDARTDANPKLFTYTVDKAGVAGTCTAYDNTATFTTNDSATTGSSSKRVTVCVGSNLSVTKTATGTFNRDDLWSITKDADKTTVDVADGGSATFNYSVTVTPTGHTDSGFALSGTIHVVNPNDWEDITATVTDVPSVGGGATCAVTDGVNVVVPKSGSVDLAYSCTFSGAPSNGTNTATATWNANTFHTPSGTASGSTAAAFTIAKETHETITVVDDKTDPANPVTLGTRDAADGPHTFTYSLTKQGVAGTCTSYTNTATITETGQSAAKTVTVCVGSNLTVSKTALATDHRTYLWTLAKDVDKTRVTIGPDGTAHFTYTVTATPAGQTADGWSVTGDITVSNPNDWEDITANVTDSLNTGGAASCDLSKGPSVVVPADSSVVIHYSCSFESQPADGTNTATATWDEEEAATPNGSASGTAEVVFVPATQTNRSITVVDDKTDPAHPVTLGSATWGEEPTSFTYSLDKQGVAGTCTNYTNTASITETGQSAVRTVTVCVGSGLIMTASSAASFNRAYAWAIDKSVDQTTLTTPNGTDGTFSYTVTVTPSGITDSAYGMGGSVTVTNPNDWEPITTTVTVASDVGGGATCTVTDGVGRVVPVSGALTLPYTCSFAGTPAVTGTTTATAIWDATAASTGTLASASASAPVSFAVAGETHRQITVVDDKTDPAKPVTLGTWRYEDGVHAFTYSLTKAGVASVCTDYTNIASIVETAQSDTQVATLCHPFTGGGGTPVVNPPQGGGLPFTGDALGLLARTAAALLAAGLVLLVISRKRRWSERRSPSC
jgi:hypothetical protein